MDRDEALKLLKGGPEGITEWNQRRRAGETIPDLIEANLIDTDLSRADLTKADLRGADFSRANLSHADLSEANLSFVNDSRMAKFVDSNLGHAVLRDANLLNADLRRADLHGADLSRVNLSLAVLIGAHLSGVNLNGAKLTSTDLSGVNLSGVNLRGALLGITELGGANLSGAKLNGADFIHANLSNAILSDADLGQAKLRSTNLIGADFSGASCELSVFIDIDLSSALGLDSVNHKAPSSIGTDTLFRSQGKIPEAFYRGCGLSPWEILAANLYRPELTPAGLSELQYQIFDAWTKGRSMINGCFVSYSHIDAKFVDKLRDHLYAEGVNVWLDRHDMVAGTIQDQVWRAIQLHHVVILVLSEDSVKSDWVENELDMARQKEKAEGRVVLCPVALDDAWKAKVEAKDSPGDPSRQLWRTLQQKLVVDFSGWKTKAFEDSFQKLLRGLKTNYGPP